MTQGRIVMRRRWLRSPRAGGASDAWATAHSFAKSDDPVTLAPASSKLKPRRYPFRPGLLLLPMRSFDEI
jgi:hypothetical protein